MPAAAVEPRPGCKSIIPDGSYWLHWGNRRDDRWGGSLENRAQILLKTIDAIRQRVAPIFCVAVKLKLRRTSSAAAGGVRRQEVAQRVVSGSVSMVGLATALAIEPALPRQWIGQAR